MKKTVVTAVFLALFGIVQTNAQVTFNPGFRAGLNLSHFTKQYSNNYTNSSFLPDFSNKTDFYIGFLGALKLSKFYTLQPEINYSNQGSSFGSGTLNVSYVGLQIVNKIYLGDAVNMQIGTALDFATDSNFKLENDADMSFLLGLGADITKNIGLEFRVKKGLIPVFDYNNTGSHTNVLFQLGATYIFDLKQTK